LLDVFNGNILILLEATYYYQRRINIL